jgi:hypothetical protein
LTECPICTDNHPYSQYCEQLKKPSIRACKNINAGIKNRLQKEIKKPANDLERPFNDLTKEAFCDILKKCENKSK